jgi:small acid-soluble spore protein (thioredoxin-like protein)
MPFNTLKHRAENNYNQEVFMKPNPDNRDDNVERIQNNIDMTIDNIHRANEMIEKTSDQKMKQTLKDKNERRMDALDGMRHEIKDEANASKNRELQ